MQPLAAGGLSAAGGTLEWVGQIPGGFVGILGIARGGGEM